MVTDFGKKRKLKPLKNFLIASAAIFVLLVSVVLIISDIRIYGLKKKLDFDVSNLQQKAQNLQDSNNNLRGNISQADNPRYIEKTAREELDMQKPGEKVVSFVVTQDKSQPKTDSAKNSFASFWLGWIGNIWTGIKNFYEVK